MDAVDCFVSNKGEVNQAMYKMLERYENPKIIVTNAPDDKLSGFGWIRFHTLYFHYRKIHPKLTLHIGKSFLKKTTYQ